jgi:hypothetical protein
LSVVHGGWIFILEFSDYILYCKIYMIIEIFNLLWR